ncbi:hypothetical protein [Tabrizicola sp.]|uniref:hypothetical protein n=1 Tax=Tabrizicola sp. TaxID=2005166 RepID=UPI001A54FA97|nr:hypothetical protein [Tabrizicola sp.]MBL9072093.1 hypothetical protein [Tabrizicola sp.]
MKRTIYLVLALAGCVADASATSPDSRSYVKYLNAFASVCLAEDLTENKAKAAARASGVSFDGMFGYKTNDAVSTGIILTGYRAGGFDRDKAYTSYTCAARFRGTWADEIFPDVQEKLASAGFASISRFNRKAYSPAQAYDGGEIVTIAGGVSRGGKSFAVSITQSPPGSDTSARTSYISNTTITISSAPAN